MDTIEQFAIPDKVSFSTQDGLTFVDVNSSSCTARIALQGAQLLSWAPIQEKPVIWLSSAAKLTPGKSLRGGIPVCWPWFGPHSSESGYPSHGVARTADWQLVESTCLVDDRIQITLLLSMDEAAKTMWPYACSLKAIFTFGATLEVELITQNSDQRAFSITEALHTYFAVSDVRDIKVVGLDGCSYADKVDGGKLKQQRIEITFVGETDAVYFNTKSECEIVDNKWKRKIHIQKRGSQSTVVWNPWRDKSASMGDMPEEGYLQMLCVETANALNDSVTVKPGEEHRLWMSVNVKK